MAAPIKIKIVIFQLSLQLYYWLFKKTEMPTYVDFLSPLNLTIAGGGSTC